MTRKPPTHPKRQRGVVLAVVLILLLVMTLLGLAALRGTLMEERMSANQFDRSLAFQAAEAALREGEALAATKPTPAFGSPCSNGICGKPDPMLSTDNQRWLGVDPDDPSDDDAFWNSPATRAATVAIGDLTANPRFIVEWVDSGLPLAGECTTGIDVSPGAACTGSESRYRITARSQAEGRAEVMLQSMYAVP